MKGGLGNQLFIYAFAKGMLARTDAKIEFDLRSGFVRDRYCQRYWLSRFNLQLDNAGAWNSYLHPFGEVRRRVTIALNKTLPISVRSYVVDPEYGYIEDIAKMAVKPPIYFDGYWESYRYFEHVRQELAADLKLDAPDDPENREMARAIQKVDAIGVHARRLKGVPNAPGAIPNEKHPQLSLDYYRNAIFELSQGCRKPHVFCFSDYPEWFRERLKLDLPLTYVTHNHAGGDASSWKDLWLLSQCRHFIIANSSFSWWGAWLGSHSDKRVIFPKPSSWNWVRNADMMPESWEGRPA